MPNIFHVWEAEGWEEPMIEEQFSPDRTTLALSFRKKKAIKIGDKKQAIKTSDKKQAIKTAQNRNKIRLFLEKNGEAKTSDIAKHIELSMVRTRAILGAMVTDGELESIGGNRNRRYRLSSSS